MKWFHSLEIMSVFPRCNSYFSFPIFFFLRILIIFFLEWSYCVKTYFTTRTLTSTPTYYIRYTLPIANVHLFGIIYRYLYLYTCILYILRVNIRNIIMVDFHIPTHMSTATNLVQVLSSLLIISSSSFLSDIVLSCKQIRLTL